MLMSLTTRFCPMPPVDPRGTTSVVAIPTPSFWFTGAACWPGVMSAEEETFQLYGGGMTSVAPIACPEPWGTRYETRRKSADSGFRLEELGHGAEEETFQLYGGDMTSVAPIACPEPWGTRYETRRKSAD